MVAPVVSDSFQIQLFAKAPRRGAVKTRMMPHLSPQQCLQLHIELLQHGLARLAALPGLVLQLTASEPHPQLLALSQRYRVALGWQCGNDLGERMHNAVVEGLQHHRGVLLVGADCPFIDADYVAQAVAALVQGAPVVIGPAADGGYALIGLSEPIPALFSGLPWGSSRVLTETRQLLRDRKLPWRELPVVHDIDRPEDLEQLRALPALAHWAR